MSNTFILLSRSLIESEVFASQKLLKIWIWCLLKANFKTKFVPVKIGKGEKSVKIKRGEFLFGRFKAEDELFIDGSTIYKLIKKLEEMGNISIQSSNHYSIITICNYDTYQDGNNYKVAADEQPSSSQVAADEQPSSTTKKENKENKDKKYKAFISLFNEITNRKFKGSDKVEGQFNARLLEGNHYSDFKTAITNARNSKHLKENPEYLTPEYITRPNKLDQWINAKPEKKVIKKQEGNPNSIFPTLEEFAAKGITFDD